MKFDSFRQTIDKSKVIVIIQADNPDGDSLASSLALEGLLESYGKKVVMYCGVEIPSYLRYMQGWDRVVHDLPNNFDASIIVDTSALTLLETLTKRGQISWIKTKPCIIIDHHQTDETIEFASLVINIPAVSTGEIIFNIAKELSWDLAPEICEFIAYSILSDSLGLTSEAVSSETFHMMGELLEKGVSVAKLDDARRLLNKKSKRIVEYKGKLLQRIHFYDDPRIATITIPFDEIEKYSHEYNPSMLVIDEMRMTEGVCVAIAFKTYPDGKITAKIRSNFGYKIAAELAEHFGGGGHVYAAGFKIQNKREVQEVINECVKVACELLGELNEEKSGETIQYSV